MNGRYIVRFFCELLSSSKSGKKRIKSEEYERQIEADV